MAVRIVFLGPLREAAGTDSLEVSAPLDWDGLLAVAGDVFTPDLADAATPLDDIRTLYPVVLEPPLTDPSD